MSSVRRLGLLVMMLCSAAGAAHAQAAQDPAATTTAVNDGRVTFGVLSFLQYGVELHEQEGRSRDDPQQPVPVIRAEQRVRRDARRIVVRQPGEQPRPEHGEEGGEGSESRRAKSREALADPPPVVRHGVGRRARTLAPIAREAQDLAGKQANARRVALVVPAMRGHAPRHGSCRTVRVGIGSG